MFYSCTVCGYSQMRNPPKDYNICPCCGTEFGYDDFSKSHRMLRNDWLSRGAPWFSSNIRPQFPWDGFRQVIEAGLPFDVPLPASNIILAPIKINARVRTTMDLQVA